MSQSNERKWEDLLELGDECHERFLIQDNISVLASLGIGFAGVSLLQGSYCVARCNPEYHTILYTTEGRGKLFTPSGEQAIEPNTLVILPEGQPFHFELDADYWKTAWFCLDDDELWRHLHQQQASVQYCESAQAIYHLLCHLYYENNSKLQGSSIRQIQQYLHHTVGKNHDEHKEQTVQSRRLETLFEHIQEQLHFPWTIEIMAEHVYYSPPHLHRLCKKAYQQSPIQRLIHFRMERAKHLLTDTDWSLIQIANTVGYHDVFNFSTRFKKSVGMAPSRYRLKTN